ncbi:hypothetical protein ACFQ1I_43000 [Kitasatospora arboriphila]
MSRSFRGSVGYRAVLSLPHARAPFAAALLARLSYGVLPLPLLLALRDGTGSFAAAGAAAGVFGLLSALLGPARARLVSRRPAALMVLTCCYTLLLFALAAAPPSACRPGRPCCWPRRPASSRRPSGR